MSIKYVMEDFNYQFGLYRDDVLVLSGEQDDYSFQEIMQKAEISGIEFIDLDYKTASELYGSGDSYSSYRDFEFPENMAGIEEILEVAKLAAEVEKKKRIKTLRSELEDLTNK